MSRNKRRLIFYSLVVIFFVVTPPIILYAIGYSFDWQGMKLVKTGGIYLKTTPGNAQITLDGKSQGNTPRLISSLLPGNHNILITKHDYYPWQKALPVQAELVTEARNILLLSQKINPELFDANATSSIQNLLQTEAEKANQQLAGQTASSSAGWLLNSTEQIFYISQISFNLYQENLDGTGQTQISKNPLPTAHYQVIANNGNRFLLLANNGNLYYLDRNNGLFQTISQGVKGATLAPDNKKFIYWTENELWVYFLEEILIQPNRQVGDQELITRYSQPISQAIFCPDNEHVSFVVNDQIKITELDGRDKRNTIDFIQAPNPQIYFDSKNNYFYYLTGNQILRINLNI